MTSRAFGKQTNWNFEKEFLQKGDTIPCQDKKDLRHIRSELYKEGVEAEAVDDKTLVVVEVWRRDDT